MLFCRIASCVNSSLLVGDADLLWFGTAFVVAAE